MKVVVNATPIIALSRIRKLELLHKIYGKVFIAKGLINALPNLNLERPLKQKHAN